MSVNCASIPRDLITSELFGHEKGAFTGALQRRMGRFELAEGGTLFLDEIGELPAETQIALLRVFQEKEFERVGSNLSIRADVRVIAATNRDLQAAIDAGTFRSDLFIASTCFHWRFPPCANEAKTFRCWSSTSSTATPARRGKAFREIDKRTMDLLQLYPWPGNIRELQNVIERSVIVCETESFSVDESWLSRGTRPIIRPPSSSPTSVWLRPRRRQPLKRRSLKAAAECPARRVQPRDLGCTHPHWMPRSDRCGSTSIAFTAPDSAQSRPQPLRAFRVFTK